MSKIQIYSDESLELEFGSRPFERLCHLLCSGTYLGSTLGMLPEASRLLDFVLPMMYGMKCMYDVTRGTVAVVQLSTELLHISSRI